MNAYRHVKLIPDAEDGSVHIPRDFALPDGDVVIRKNGDRLTIEPASPNSRLAELLASWEPLGEDEGLPIIERGPAREVDL